MNEIGEVRIENESRRHFLQGAAGLTLAVYLPAASAETAAAGPRTSGRQAGRRGELRAQCLRAHRHRQQVTVFAKHLEMGQGSYTGLATIVAEELDAAWTQVRVEGAPADAKRYNNLFWGPAQGTGGSTAIANSWEQLRKAGASARAMLVGAAASAMECPRGPRSALPTAWSRTRHRAGRRPSANWPKRLANSRCRPKSS